MVDETVVPAKKVVRYLNKFRLIAKSPELMDGGAAVGMMQDRAVLDVREISRLLPGRGVAA